MGELLLDFSDEEDELDELRLSLEVLLLELLEDRDLERLLLLFKVFELLVEFFFLRRPNSSYSSESDECLCLYSTFSLSLNPPPSPDFYEMRKDREETF